MPAFFCIPVRVACVPALPNMPLPVSPSLTRRTASQTSAPVTAQIIRVENSCECGKGDDEVQEQTTGENSQMKPLISQGGQGQVTLVAVLILVAVPQCKRQSCL